MCGCQSTRVLRKVIPVVSLLHDRYDPRKILSQAARQLAGPWKVLLQAARLLCAAAPRINEVGKGPVPWKISSMSIGLYNWAYPFDVAWLHTPRVPPELKAKRIKVKNCVVRYASHAMYRNYGRYVALLDCMNAWCFEEIAICPRASEMPKCLLTLP